MKRNILFGLPVEWSITLKQKYKKYTRITVIRLKYVIKKK